MQLDEARQKFIQSWGTLGSAWGINKAMGQIHALLLVSEDPLSTEEVMEELQISRGNANMNIRALMDWGIVEKKIEPVLRVLNDIQQVAGNSNEVKEFKKVTKNLGDFTRQSMEDKFITSIRIGSSKNALARRIYWYPEREEEER